MYTADITINNKNQKLKREKLLTIGIITKNECEKLERCLKSLMPLKEAFDCEIIVTDTGSTDNTVEMAKKYADQILHFEWNNDFAAARNTGLKASKGLWFMWIDSDEWLENPEELIGFFKSGEYKRYGSASIGLVDVMDKDMKNYINQNIVRLVMRYEDMWFVGAIHESFPKVISPINNIGVKIFHDGYVFADEKQRQAKYDRNFTLLIKKYEEDPSNLHWIKCIVQHYRFEKNWEKSAEFCNIGLALLKNTSNKVEDSYKLHFEINLAASFLDLEKNEAALELMENIGALNKKDEYRRLDVYYILFGAYFKLGYSSKALETAEVYIRYYLILDTLDRGNEASFLLLTNQRATVSKALFEAIKNMVASNKSDKEIVLLIQQVMEKLYGKNSELFLNEYIGYIHTCIFDLKRYEIIKQLYEDVDNNYINLQKSEIENMIRRFLNQNKAIVETKEQSELIKTISNLKLETVFGKLCRYLNYDSIGDTVEAKSALNLLLSEIDKDTELALRAEAYYGAIKYSLPFELILGSLDLFNESNFLEHFIFKKKNDYSTVFEYYRDYGIEGDDFRKIYFWVAIMEVILVQTEEFRTEIFEIFRALLPRLLDNLYNTKLLNETNLDMLPPIFRFAFYIKQAEINKDKDVLLYINSLKKAFVNYPLMKAPILNIVSDIEGKLSQEEARKNELEKLATGVKNKIYELITFGHDEEAINVICQLQSIIPDDRELKELKSRIISK